MTRARIVLLIAALTTASNGVARPNAGATAELLWDTYGVPHVFAKDTAGLFYGFGCAQLQSHGNLLLRLYGRARGRAAEYWGEKYLDGDRWVRTNGVAARADEWYRQQSPSFRRLLDAFAGGINACSDTYRQQLAEDVRVVLPVTGADVLAHVQRVIYFNFLVNAQQVAGAARSNTSASEWREPLPVAASNAWAIAPRRSASNRALLLANPHLWWSDQFLFYEAHLAAPGIDVYGATLVGFPVLGIAFTDRIGWTHTVNTLDAADLYQLTRDGEGYRFDGGARAFATDTQAIAIKTADGTLRTEPHVIRHSVHGPVVAEGPLGPIALRVAGLEEARALEQWWAMARARNLGEFEAALKQMQIPLFSVIYADQDGHILNLFNGRLPVRPAGPYNWRGVVAGDTSATLWTGTHRYGDLPRIVDPPSGWLQSTNDPPWSTTLPAPLDPRGFSPHLPRPSMAFRTRRSIRMLVEEPQMTFAGLIRSKFSDRMELADCVLEPLLAVARQSADPIVRRGAEVLSRWDRTAGADSRGAVLFEAFVRRWWAATGERPFATPLSADDPLETPRGIADPDVALAALTQAVADVESRFGRLEVAWGEVYRIRVAGRDLPASGGPGDPLGIFQVMQYSRNGEAIFGDSFIAAVEFSRPVRAEVLMVYGNSSQPGSAHATDQLELFASKRLRPAWRTRAEILAHLERRESLSAAGESIRAR